MAVVTIYGRNIWEPPDNFKWEFKPEFLYKLFEYYFEYHRVVFTQNKDNTWNGILSELSDAYGMDINIKFNPYDKDLSWEWDDYNDDKEQDNDKEEWGWSDKSCPNPIELILDIFLTNFSRFVADAMDFNWDTLKPTHRIVFYNEKYKTDVEYDELVFIDSTSHNIYMLMDIVKGVIADIDIYTGHLENDGRIVLSEWCKGVSEESYNKENNTDEMILDIDSYELITL